MTIDTDALSDIRQMIIVAIRTTESLGEAIHQQRPEAFELLSFSLHDALRRMKELEDGSIAAADAGKAGPDPGPVNASKTVQPATVAPRPGSGGQRPDTAVKTENDWRDALFGIEGPLCEAVYMAQIADEMVPEDDGDNEDYRYRFTFAVNHSRHLLEDLRRRYYAAVFGERQG